MISRIYKTALLILLSAVCFSACKKEEEETTYSYLSGKVLFELPEYVLRGDSFTFHPTGIKHPEGGNYGFCWKIEPFMEKYDTVRFEAESISKSIDYSFTIPDTLCTVSVTGMAFAEGYYGSSTTKKAVIIDDSRRNGSLQAAYLDEEAGDFTFIDPRDGKDYYCTTIGDYVWFKENLAYEKTGVPYGKISMMSHIFGCYYSWNEAQNACPEGWELPSQELWANAASVADPDGSFDKDSGFPGISGSFMIDGYFNDSKMWEFWPTVKITNSTGLSAIPVGYGVMDQNGGYVFNGVLGYAVFWTSDDVDEELGCHRDLYVSNPDILTGSADKENFFASVRCVRKQINEVL